jgi:hypothetical protein
VVTILSTAARRRIPRPGGAVEPIQSSILGTELLAKRENSGIHAGSALWRERLAPA